RYPFPRGSCATARRRRLQSPSDLRGTSASSRAAGDAHDGFHTSCDAASNSWSPPLKKGPWRTWKSDENPPEATGIPKAQFSPRSRKLGRLLSLNSLPSIKIGQYRLRIGID